ncbi:MAG: S9 family peptidase [Rhodothermia bacterium]|nr:S9 family peptidase [Rhodothermia bacterium]
MRSGPSARSIRLIAAALVLAQSLPAVTATDAQPSRPFAPEDVFQLEWATEPQISPDGRYVVYVRNGMDIMNDRRQRRLWIIATDGTGHRKLTLHEGNESSPRWSPDGTRVVYVRGTEAGAEIYVQWMDTGQTARLTQLERSPSGLSWSPDGTRLAFSMLVPKDEPKLDVKMPSPPKGAIWADEPRVVTRVRHEADGSGYIEPGYRHLFVVPAEGGTPRQVTTGDFQHGGTPSWLPDGTGLVFSANRIEDWEHDHVESEVHVVALADQEIITLTDRDGPDTRPAVSPDGSRIAYLGFDDRVTTFQNTRVYLMNVDGSGRRLLTEASDLSFDTVVWHPDGDGLYVSYESSGVRHIAHLTLDGSLHPLIDQMGGTVIGRPYIGGSFTVSETGWITYTHSRSTRPADVAVTQGPKSGLRVLTSLNKDLLADRTLGDVESITWTSSLDNRRIQGWVVKPPDFDPNLQYPFLLEIHGGPISAYGPHFSPEIQLYAAAGYVVLYANPRGSTGYGEEFANLLHHDYPGGDYNDLMSGVDAVLEASYVDPEQLFVTGGSAGGTMTAWIVGSTDRFRAAVVTKPVMNWYSKVLVADNWPYYHDYRYPGSPWENPEAYLAESPISLAGNVSTPTMVMVGADDLRTPLSEAKQLYHALTFRKIDTALVEIPGASHNIARRPSQLIAKVAYTLAWFATYRASVEFD